MTTNSIPKTQPHIEPAAPEGDENTEQAERGTIFLAAPIQTYGTPEYEAALELLECRHPHDRILSARDLWTSSRHWRETYKDVLRPVCRLYVLTDCGYVGKGVYAEWAYLCASGGAVPATVLLPGGSEWSGFSLLIVDPFDWSAYAVARNASTGELSTPELAASLHDDFGGD